MFGTHFYHETTRKLIAVFGSLFNNIDVVRRDASGNILNQEQVPISWGPRQKFIERLREQPTLEESKVALKLPRMSYDIGPLSFNPERQLPKYNKKSLKSDCGDGDARNRIYQPVAYKIPFILTIATKTQEDGLQIIEQILPYFKPSLGLRIKPLAATESTFTEDLKITLLSASPNLQYEGDFRPHNSYIWTLDFDIEAMFYGPAATESSVIKTVIVNYNDYTTEDEIQDVTIAVDPANADPEDNYTVTVDYTYGYE